MRDTAMDATEQEDTPMRNRSLFDLLLYAALALVALLPRVLDLGGFVIEDEARYWIGRSHRFLDALEHGNFAATAITTHPGVTTMWLGSAGIVLRRSLLEWGILEQGTYANLLAFMRLPVALVHVAGILVGTWLLRKMLPLPVALLAALLWAADPFVIAFSRVLHVDGLATTFATLSILAACYVWYFPHAHPQSRHGQGHRYGWLLLSGACAGLAILSKSSALVVPGAVAALAFWGTLRHPHPEAPATVPMRLLRSWLPRMLVWGAFCVATLALVWPAVLTNPMRVYDLLRIGIEVEGASPHVQGNYFLGHEDPEPGVRFYPVALVLRLTPLTLLGLLLLPGVLHTGSGNMEREHTPRITPPLVIFVLLVTLALSLFSKKLNRYLVLAFPALDILAAVGLAWGIARLSAIGGRLSAIGYRGSAIGYRLLAGVLVLAALLNVAWWHPYHIAAFNQVFGGAAAGPRTFLIGAGEGLEQVAAWLNQQPNITGVVTASTMTPPLQPYLRDGAQSLPPDGDDLPDSTGYVVVYVRNVWNGALPPFDQFYPEATPLHTVSIHGVAYAWIYQVVPPIAHPLDARFVAGDATIALEGYEVATEAISSTGMLSLTLQWQASAPLHQDYLLFVHVLDAQGRQVGQTDAPPAGADAPTSTWQPGRVMPWVHPVPVPRDLAPGSYWLSLGLYDAETFARLPLQDATPPPAAPDDGAHALLLPLEVP